MLRITLEKKRAERSGPKAFKATQSREEGNQKTIPDGDKDEGTHTTTHPRNK